HVVPFDHAGHQARVLAVLTNREGIRYVSTVQRDLHGGWIDSLGEPYRHQRVSARNKIGAVRQYVYSLNRRLAVSDGGVDTQACSEHAYDPTPRHSPSSLLLVVVVRPVCNLKGVRSDSNRGHSDVSSRGVDGDERTPRAK